MLRRLFTLALSTPDGRWTVEGSNVITPDGRTRRLPSKIVDSEEVDGVLVVVVEPKPGEPEPRNVYGVRRKGKVWRIAHSDAHSYNENNPYVRIWRIPYDGMVQVVDSAGVAVAVLVRTGEVEAWGIIDGTGSILCPKRCIQMSYNLDDVKNRRSWWGVIRRRHAPQVSGGKQTHPRCPSDLAADNGGTCPECDLPIAKEAQA